MVVFCLTEFFENAMLSAGLLKHLLAYLVFVVINTACKIRMSVLV